MGKGRKMIYVILAALALAAICFSIRFYALKHSIREACRELEEIRKEPICGKSIIFRIVCGGFAIRIQDLIKS